MARDTRDGDGGLRELVQKYGVVIGGLLLVIALGVLAIQLFGGNPDIVEQGGYYSSDDGETYYGGPRNLVPPFEKDGVEHVRAVVARPRDGGEPRVLYLVKYKPEAAERVREAEAINARPPVAGQLVKRPGDAEWLDADDPKNAQKLGEIRKPQLSDGTRMILVNPSSKG